MNWVPRWLGAGSGAATSDEEAMRRVQAAGDPAAFAQLLARWELPIRRLCVRMTGDEHRGEDLAQEAFARVFAHRHQFAADRKFSTWLWRIALNLCHEEGRRTVRRGERTLDMTGGAGGEPLGPRAAGGDDRDDGGDGPHGRAVRAEHARLVRDALRRLPEAHRTVVVLREYENLKFREIAEVLDVPEGTVKWRMAEALTRLGEQLKPILAADDDGDTDKKDDDDETPAATRSAKERLAL